VDPVPGQARDLFIECREELEPLVTHRFSIRDAEQAFTIYEHHEQGIVKAVLDVMTFPRKSGHEDKQSSCIL
jgi:threonine dehydrogenase-like Zn-dependent dehydrogenase